MESANCNARASDAVKSTWSQSVTVKCEFVKEEPEWEECSVSEAAEGLYAGQKIKYELEIGPEVVQEQDIAYTTHNVVKEDYLYEPKAAAGGDAKDECSNNWPGDGPRCNGSSEQQKRFGSGFSMRERLSVEDQPIKPLNASRDCELTRSLASSKLKLEECGVEKSRAKEMPPSCRLQPNDKLSTSKSDLQCKPYSCNICNKRFGAKGALTKHKLIHSGEKQHSCKICYKQFTQHSTLTRHILTHTGEKPYSCNVCNKRFRVKVSMTRHLQTHTGEKPYKCDVCNKRFAIKPTLTIHKRIHADEKPHSCDVCKKRFTHKSSLTSHNRVHTGEKPVSCDVCNKRFINRSGLAQHVRLHTGERPYACNLCDQRFKHLSHLTDHLRIHTGEKPFGCHVCNKRFTTKSKLKKHIQTHAAGK